jgi:hypothetical protein
MKFLEKDLGTLDREIESLLKPHDKARFIHFCDDNICGTHVSIKKFMHFMADRQYPLKWYSFFDARFIDDALAENLKRSNCTHLKIGMESGDDTILKNMRKPCRVRHYQRAIESLAKSGVSTDLFFIVGFPGENHETISRTVETICSFTVPKYSVNHVLFFPFILAPLAPIFEAECRKEFGLKGYMHEWSHPTMHRSEVPQIIHEMFKQVSTIQPSHGNIEIILFQNMPLLKDIDALRGELIRSRLVAGREQAGLWERMKSLVEKIKVVKPGEPDARGTIARFPRFY